jgi:RNA polymerase sigma factor (sigma-70 family)
MARTPRAGGVRGGSVGAGSAVALTEAELLARIRSGDTAVLAEFIFRYQGLVMGQARRFHVAPGERRTWSLEILHDVALALMRPRKGVPRSITAYLMRAAHNRWISDHRAVVRGRPELAEHTPTDWEVHEGALAGMSEYSRRALIGPDSESERPSAALERLSAALDRTLDDDERRLMAWVGRDIPQHEIAQAMRISREAVAQRIRRLRARLWESAAQHAATASPPERAELARFFHRARAPALSKVAER